MKGVLYVAVTHQVTWCLAALGKEMAVASGGGYYKVSCQV